jgi:hypothetical protein
MHLCAYALFAHKSVSYPALPQMLAKRWMKKEAQMPLARLLRALSCNAFVSLQIC